MLKWKCYYCGKEAPDKGHCTCNKSKQKWRYITTNTIKDEGKYRCKCGNDKFVVKAHMDFENSYSYTYECTRCLDNIGVHFQR